jgi:hypothetical protein
MALRDAGLYSTDLSGDLAGGRLLLHSPDDADSCNGSRAGSSGLLIIDDAPPWDRWIAFVYRAVVSWIPPSVLAGAEDGVWVAAMDCVCGADSAALSIALLSRAEGFLLKIEAMGQRKSGHNLLRCPIRRASNANP